MGLANSAALAAAGISADAESPAGGDIVRDADGRPTGVLKDNAQSLVADAMPPFTAERMDRALEAAMRYVAARGVTSVHHMGTWEHLAVFERARERGTLRTRIYAAVPLASWERLRDAVGERGRGDAWLRIGALKGFVDGSLGSHTAAMLEPFTDAPGDRGLLVNTPADLHDWIAGADAAGLHVIVHAIGDRANRLLLDIYEQVGRDHPPRDRRFRIEHAQHLHPDDIPRFASLDVIASMQPYHAIDDGRWAERLIGRQRARYTYPIGSLSAAGARLAFGSDWFVAPPTPLEGIYAAVTRRTLDHANPGGWIPEERIDVEEALRAYTSGSAYASYEESIKGTIEPGKLADLVLLDRDLTTVAAEEIADVRVVMTVAGGGVIHE
jgi:predicted amidohydrolase YtcJ